MEEASEMFWEWAPVIVGLVVAYTLVAFIVKVLSGNEQMKGEGWKHIRNLLIVVAFGFVVQMAFPGVGKKLGEMMDDPCKLFGASCRN